MIKSALFKFSDRKIRIAVLAAVWVLVCLFFTPVYTTVSLTFADDPHGEVIATVFAGPRKQVTVSDAKYRVVNHGTANVSYLDIQIGNRCSLKRIDPLDQYYQSGEPLALTGITISKNGILTARLTGEEISAYFSANEDMELLEGENFAFQVVGQDPQLLPNDAFQTLYAKTPFSVKLLSILIFGGGLALLAGLVWWFLKEISGMSDFYRCTACLLFGGILAAASLTVYVGFRNPFYLNPDEYQTLEVINYYFSHFMPPDMRDMSLINSYAVYGTSRHSEWNLFYLLTAKLGQIFTDEMIRARFFSAASFCVMMGIALKNIRKHSALLFVVLLTPQVWYLFSYCTSDSFDLFMSFLCVYELIKENSMLNQVLRNPFCKKHILYILLLGFLFVQILWAKASFYPVLIFMFCILLIRLFYPSGDSLKIKAYSPGERKAMQKTRRVLFQKYLVIAGVTLLMFIVRYMITDYPYYGFAKYDVCMEMIEKTALYEYKFSTPPMERAYSMSFMEKGITLGEFFTQFEFNKNLFRTFSGFFGSYAFGAADWYYVVMGGLYLVLCGYLVFRIYKLGSLKVWWELGVSVFTIVIHYVLIVYNGWVIDFQPQGRYLIPILVYFAYLVHQIDREGKDKILRGILCLTCLFSLYCFYVVGVYNLIPAHGIQS